MASSALCGAGGAGAVGDREHSHLVVGVALSLHGLHGLVRGRRRVGVLAVGEQHHGGDALRRSLPLHQLEAVDGGIVDRGSAVGDQVLHRSAQPPLVAGEWPYRNQRLDPVGEDREADAVLPSDLIEEDIEALLGPDEPVLVVHRARGVDDQQHVRGLAVLAPGLLDAIEHARLGKPEHSLRLGGINAVLPCDRSHRLLIQIGRAKARACGHLGGDPLRQELTEALRCLPLARTDPGRAQHDEGIVRVERALRGIQRNQLRLHPAALVEVEQRDLLHRPRPRRSLARSRASGRR
jgi:hypothetical protein